MKPDTLGHGVYWKNRDSLKWGKVMGNNLKGLQDKIIELEDKVRYYEKPLIKK